MYACRERNVENVEQNQCDETLLQESQGDLLQLLVSEDASHDVEQNGRDELAEQDEQHHVAVVDEGTGHAHLLVGLGQLGGLGRDADVEPVEGPELGERGQVHVEEAVGGEREVGELQHAEEFQSHDFAAEDRNDEDGIADNFGSLQHLLHLIRCSTFTMIIIKCRNSGLICNIKHFPRREMQYNLLIYNISIILSMYLYKCLILNSLNNLNSLIHNKYIL